MKRHLKIIGGAGPKKYFSSAEEENQHLKAQVEYLKKLNPNLHWEGSSIRKPGSRPSGRKPSVVFDNVLNRQFTADEAQKKLVTDITYIRVVDDFIYLSVVLDLHNNEVVAWELSERNDLEFVLSTVKQLGKGEAILHSDQGFQYTTKTYANLLEELHLTGSRSRRGNCFDNACIESFFSHLKTEKLYLEKPKDTTHARKLIANTCCSTTLNDSKKSSTTSPRWSTGNRSPHNTVYLTGL